MTDPRIIPNNKMAGFYYDRTDSSILIAHLGEILMSRDLDDTQEARAALYGAIKQQCDEGDYQLVIISEDDVPSIKDLANALPS